MMMTTTNSTMKEADFLSPIVIVIINRGRHLSIINKLREICFKLKEIQT